MSLPHVLRRLKRFRRLQDFIKLLHPVILIVYIFCLSLLIFGGSSFRLYVVGPDSEQKKRVIRIAQITLRQNRTFGVNSRTHQCIVSNRTYQYLYSDPPGEACYLRNKLAQPNMPVIHSVFADEASESVIFTGVKWLAQKWHLATFICIFENGEISVSDPVMKDERSFGYLTQYLFVITCPMPKMYTTRSNFTVSLSMDITNKSVHFMGVYKNLTVCRPGLWPVKRHFLAMCTMVRNMDKFLPEWIKYHVYVGVDHFYVYDNLPDENSTLKGSLRKYIEAGFVTVVPWPHQPSENKTYLEVQIAHENDCVWRHKHNVDWMIKVDVDEFVQPMHPNKPRISDYLIGDPTLPNLSSIRLDNWFFGRLNTTNIAGLKSIFERNQYRPRRPTPQNIGRDKNILQLKNVHYFKIHGVKLGGPARSANPFNELRVVHYRMDNPRHRNFDLPEFNTKDRSMARLWRRATIKFDRILTQMGL